MRFFDSKIYLDQFCLIRRLPGGQQSVSIAKFLEEELEQPGTKFNKSNKTVSQSKVQFPH